MHTERVGTTKESWKLKKMLKTGNFKMGNSDVLLRDLEVKNQRQISELNSPEWGKDESGEDC